MVFVSVSETYDLSTKPNKMSVIGIHTPTRDIIQKTYPGLCVNSKYCRIVKQDVTMACASMLPADPLQVGVEAGDIAPQDMFNPILYKAVSNESMTNLEARLIRGVTADTDVTGPSLVKEDNVTTLTNEFNLYYSLLSDRDGFKTAMPQQGLSMKGLVPFVFDKYYNFGTNQAKTSDFVPILASNGNVSTMNAMSMRGRAHPMPRFNTTYLTSGNASSGTNNQRIDNGMSDGNPKNNQALMPDIMPVYTACIIMPPCKLNRLYYRLIVRTILEFTEIRPIQEVMALTDGTYAPLVYQSDYDIQSEAMTSTLGMVDTMDADIEKIMEGA